jgi:fatty-acyl-CoA synthase
MFPGRMMNFPLTVTHLFEHAARFHGKAEVVSVLPDKSRRRATFADVHARGKRLASALAKLGVKEGDRVATLAWNHQQHHECYLAVPSMGAALHTLNLRLHPTEIGYIANHAGDKVIVVDQSLLPLFEKFRASVKSLEHVIVVADKGEPVGAGMLDYEKLLADASPDFTWPELDENAGAMICYTSGTTGNPKGVLYSHRSTVLHALVATMPDITGTSMTDVLLPVVPMFHAAAWGIPYIATAAGAKIVFPGPHLDAPSLVDLMESERVTIAGGVPTIWLGILQLLDTAVAEGKKRDLSSVRHMMIGGSAAPPAMMQGFQERHGLIVRHAWGMTETNPIGTVARVKPHLRGDAAHELPVRSTQGFAIPFVEQRIADDEGKLLPWDGKSMGELEVRGPWVASSYMNDEGRDRWTADGWFKTGDVVTIDGEGYVTITDRSKDVIKSGGEWISSVAVENALMGHPAVLEAAVFAAQDPKWGERPVAAVTLKPNAKATEAELSAHLADKLVKWAIPDAYVFVEQVPRTSTGKFLKTKLRELYGDVLTKRR